ncbi:hypothetical protein Alsa1_CDS0250 [Staphylococcus phage Alsa_1]|nr:hypothetical protein Alsa1_CDS0250 [Staphylococcus phage Alsa_1]WNM50920.1 hypothetical protein Alsa3_CDS0051 [Staphylococcus phage Alsa_3]WNM51172.1 hypothetical protein Alsa4_CDS0042 [Staphylococcus phage Alsa_4]
MCSTNFITLTILERFTHFFLILFSMFFSKL